MVLQTDLCPLISLLIRLETRDSSLSFTSSGFGDPTYTAGAVVVSLGSLLADRVSLLNMEIQAVPSYPQNMLWDSVIFTGEHSGSCQGFI